MSFILLRKRWIQVTGSFIFSIKNRFSIRSHNKQASLSGDSTAMSKSVPVKR